MFNSLLLTNAESINCCKFLSSKKSFHLTFASLEIAFEFAVKLEGTFT